MDIKFKWTEDMTVHNDILDAQHQQLFMKINALLDAIINQNAEHIVDDVVRFFKEYMDQHLQFEEQYLTEKNYPDLETHKQKHSLFVDEYYRLKQKMDDGSDVTRMVLEIENFMGSWLTQHILTEDQKYARYFQLQEKNIQ